MAERRGQGIGPSASEQRRTIPPAAKSTHPLEKAEPNSRRASAGRDYLEALYEMAEEGILPVRARLAEWIGVSPASVSEAVKRLVRDGLVRTDGRRLDLTEDGERLARTLVRRHRLLGRSRNLPARKPDPRILE
jgi:DNA-binding transcriptional ArsR family regulator